MITDNPLELECRAYCRYLIGAEPDVYVLAKYSAAHQELLTLQVRRTYFDQLLLSMPPAKSVLKILDIYTRLFFKRSLLRKKWLLLVAILESSSPSYQYFDQMESLSPLNVIGSMLWQGIVFFSLIPFCIVLLGPIHFASVAMDVFRK